MNSVTQAGTSFMVDPISMQENESELVVDAILKEFPSVTTNDLLR